MTSADRFAFGKNWQAFLQSMDEQRIARAIESLQTRLQTDDLTGNRFLDIGCGSGLFSLAAHQMKADVLSIDFDPQCVACTESLKQSYGSSNPEWIIQRGSVLDESMMQSLGTFDVVYSWGVLHHTGQMEQAIELASRCVAENGTFFIAIYNDQGRASRRWLRIKQMYHRLPSLLRSVWVGIVAAVYEIKFALARAASFRSPLPFGDWRAKKDDRGMSVWHDWVDWVGGLPFEVATPDQIVNQMRKQGFVLENLTTVGNGWGCNEYVFRRTEA